MTGAPDPWDLWYARYQSIGRAQARYGYILLLVALFYSLVLLDSFFGNGHSSRPEYSVLGCDLPRSLFVAAGPFVIGFLELAIVGTGRALSKAQQQLMAMDRARTETEPYDTVPNALDFIAYVTPDMLWWVQGLAWLSYPTGLTVCAAEAFALAVAGVRMLGFGPARGAFLVLGSLLWCFVAPGIAEFWGGRIQEVRKEYRKQSGG